MSVSGYESRSDAELEGLAAGGDRDAFAELYSRHFDRVYDFCLRLLRDADEAADVAQETFIKAMAALSPKKKTAAFITWVLTIARNTALNRLRSRKTVTPSLEEVEQPEAIYREVDSHRLGSPEEAVEAKELAGLVWQAATALDPKQYSLLDLHLRQGLDSGGMAEVLGTSKNNAYVMMSRLRDSVEESITAFIMARRGRRECPDLDGMLTSRGTVFFDVDMRKAIARHIETCPTCQEQRKKLVSPTAIFGALAAVPVPLGLKQKALAEAMGQWATMAGSEAARTGGALSRIIEPLRSPFTALRQAGWFAGWKGIALLVGGLLAAVGIGGAGVALSGALDGGDGGNGGSSAAGVGPTATSVATATPAPSLAAIPPEVLQREVFIQLTDNAPSGRCYLAVVRPSDEQISRLTETLPETWTGGTLTSEPMPPKYREIFLADPSADANQIIIRGIGGGEEIALGLWTVLDRSTGLVSGLESEGADPFPVPWAVSELEGNAADTGLQFAAWHPGGDGRVVGLFRTNKHNPSGYPSTTEFTVGIRSPAGQWEGPALTITRDQLGFASSPPTDPQSTLNVHQLVPLDGDRYLLRAGPAVQSNDGAVYVVGPSTSDVIRVFETDRPFAIDRAAGLIISADGKTYSLADGSPASIVGREFGPLSALSPDGAYVMSVAAGADGAGPLQIEISNPSTNALETVEVPLDPNIGLCPDFQIAWAATSNQEATAAPTPTAIATPTPAPTQPPRPVMAVGSAVCSPTSCLAALTGSNRLAIEFDLGGGPVSGTITGEGFSNSPSCSFRHTIEITLSGTYDATTREMMGDSTVSELTEVVGPVDVCGEGGLFEGGGYEWEATLDEAGATLSGRMKSVGRLEAAIQ